MGHLSYFYWVNKMLSRKNTVISCVGFHTKFEEMKSSQCNKCWGGQNMGLFSNNIENGS